MKKHLRSLHLMPTSQQNNPGKHFSGAADFGIKQKMFLFRKSWKHSTEAVIYLCLLALLQPLVLSAGDGNDIKTISAAVDHHYNSLQTFKAEFTEIYTGAGVSRNESGTLLLKRPGKMRWDYHQPREKLFVSDGKMAYFYVPGERQARRTSVKTLDDLRSPLRYLLGKTRLEKEFSSLKLATGARVSKSGNIVISGIPKNMKDRVTQVLLEITPEHQIQRLQIEEVDGSTTEFQFASFEENKAITDKQFIFTKPPGVELIEARELQGE